MTMPAKIKQELQKRLQEIEAYRSHSLYKEARIRCQELAAFIRKTPAITNQEKLLAQLWRKVKKIDAQLETFNAFSASVEMPAKEQAIVRQFFTSGKGDKASAAFETATALLVFGQQSAALKAFSELLDDDNQRIAAAKSIIRCYLREDQVQKAAKQYMAWFRDETLPHQALDSVRIFLQAVLTKKGYKQQLPEPVVIEEIQWEPEPEEEDLLSIVLPYMTKRLRAKQVLLDINFQRGKMINCIVPKAETGLVDFLRPGTVFRDVQLNGTDMITFCSVRLTEVSKIRVGKHAGDTTITLRVLVDK